MKTIYKYEIKHKQEELHIPIGYETIRVAYQNSNYGSGLFLWAIVNPKQPLSSCTISIIHTGEEVPDGYKYICTIEKENGIILHVLKKIELSDAVKKF